MNRLHLDFTIEKVEDRVSFVDSYLSTLSFTPNEDELETISNYILWGKDINGQNVQQTGAIHIKDWDPASTESLEDLAEQPAIKETSFHSLSYPATKLPKLQFNRSAALNSAPSYIIPIFQELFHEIDTIELLINYYDIKHGRRAIEPREALLSQFSLEEQLQLQDRASHLSQFKYLKLRHYLVEKRREQYTLKDTYCTPIGLMGTAQSGAPIDDEPLSIDDIIVRPCGLYTDSNLSARLFSANPNPSLFTTAETAYIQRDPDPAPLQLDFTNPSHLLAALKLLEELEEQAAQASTIEHSTEYLLRTINYYVSQANLNDLQREVLEMKLQGRANLVIADIINQKYDKHYNGNYISTIFHQKVIPEICAAAFHHQQIVEKLNDPSAFKKCKDCGKILLKNSDNFMRLQKSKDGFAPRCKQCEKIKRGKKNG